jgi:hypothetical protein
MVHEKSMVVTPAQCIESGHVRRDDFLIHRTQSSDGRHLRFRVNLVLFSGVTNLVAVVSISILLESFNKLVKVSSVPPTPQRLSRPIFLGCATVKVPHTGNLASTRAECCYVCTVAHATATNAGYRLAATDGRHNHRRHCTILTCGCSIRRASVTSLIFMLGRIWSSGG